MKKIKKGYNLKIASLLVVIVFLSSNIVYSIDLSNKTELRVPLDTHKRIEEVYTKDHSSADPKQRIKSRVRLQDITDIRVSLDYDKSGYGEANITVTSTQYHIMEPDDIQRKVFSVLKDLKLKNPEGIENAVQAINQLRKTIVGENNIVDDSLIEALPEIVKAVSNVDDFIDILFIESKLFKIFIDERVVWSYSAYCSDFGSDVSGYLVHKAITKPIFYAYKDSFPDNKSLMSFIRLFAKNLREDHSLPDTLNNEAKFKAYLARIDKRRAQSKIKCIVLDFDGVLWLDMQGEGYGLYSFRHKKELQEKSKYYVEFQEELLALKKRGFMLAINSKNTPVDILGDEYAIKGALEEKPMVLRKEDFVVIKVNWQDKATNLTEIAQELDVGFDNILFLTNDEGERSLVNEMLPEVETPDLPNDPAQFISFIRGLKILQQDVASKVKPKSPTLSLEDYYSSLETQVIIRQGEENVPYVSQIVDLNESASPFTLHNMWSYRTEEKIRFLLKNPDYQVFTLELMDRSGSYGIVGLIILYKSEYDWDENSWVINTFCLSLKAVGRNLEQAFMAHVIRSLKEKGAKGLIGIYNANSRTQLVKDLYAKFGFLKTGSLYNPGYENWVLTDFEKKRIRSNKSFWRLELEQSKLRVPHWIKVLSGEQSLQSKATTPTFDNFNIYPEFRIPDELLYPLKSQQGELLRNKIRTAIEKIGIRNIVKMDPVKFCRILAQEFGIGFIDVTDEEDFRKLKSISSESRIYDHGRFIMENGYGGTIIIRYKERKRFSKYSSKYWIRLLLEKREHETYILYNPLVFLLPKGVLSSHAIAIRSVAEVLVQDAEGRNRSFYEAYGYSNLFVLEQEINFASRIGKAGEAIDTLKTMVRKDNKDVLTSPEEMYAKFINLAEKFYSSNCHEYPSKWQEKLVRTLNKPAYVINLSSGPVEGYSIGKIDNWHMNEVMAEGYVKEAIAELNILDEADMDVVIDAICKMIVNIRDMGSDDILIMELPDIARTLLNIEVFIDALFIEEKLFRALCNDVKIYREIWECHDGPYGGIDENRSPLVSRSVFSICRELFTDLNELRSFVRSFAKSLRENPLLVNDLNSEARLYAYLSKIIKSSFSLKKCLVLDCDGVLWDGIIGEDGIDGIKITSKHIEFQKRIKSLKENGVILAINSKNNPEDVENVFENRPDMVLKKSDFAIIKTNWQDKATNIKEISKELNIDIGSFVFLDDSPHERELVNGIYPDVLTIDPSKDPVGQIESLRDSGLFSKGPITEEDKRRTEFYLAQKEREESKESFLSIEDYFRSLKMEVAIREGNENLAYIPRIVELTQRTNQFNLTTRRYTEKDIKKFFKNPDYKIYTLDLSDKFGEAGLVGLMILNRKEGNKWYIDTFCLSCRAVRHTIEDAFIAHVAKDLKSKNVSLLLGIYRPTQRNALVKDLYKNFGFKEIQPEYSQTDNPETLWEIELNKNDLEIPDWITVSISDSDNKLIPTLSHDDNINSSL